MLPEKLGTWQGFTLIELLVVMSIVGVLVALLLPAIQSVREAARRTQCQNHLRHIGIAVVAFEGALGILPSAAYGRPYEYIPQGRRPPGDIIASTFTDLLPYLELEQVAAAYRWEYDWFHNENQLAVNAQVPMFRCPSSPGPAIHRGVGSGGGFAPSNTAAVSDYSAVYSWGFPLAIPASPPGRDIWGVSALSPVLETGGFTQPRLKQTTDGATQTLAFVEQSDHGRRWVKRRLVDENPLNGGAWAPWAGESCTWLLSYVADGSTWSPTGLGPGNVNVNNSQGIYAFHSGGANVLMLGGSVHFMAEGIDPVVLYALVTRSRGEIQREFP